MDHVQLEDVPDVELLSVAGERSYVVAVHANPEFAVVSVRHPVVLVLDGTSSDL